MLSIRQSFILVALCSAFAIAAAMVMQYVFDMEPCPLCISQRIFIILIGFAATFGAFLSQYKTGIRIAGGIGVLFALIGGSISARHVWLQSLPEDEVPICGPGLAYMFETRPMFDALSLLFSGDGHCAEVSFRFLGLSIPAWTLVLFMALASALAWLIWRSFKHGDNFYGFSNLNRGNF